MTRIEELQGNVRRLVGLVCDGNLPGIFVVGPGGLGKSHCVLEALKERGIPPAVYNSHVSPFALYQLLHEKRDVPVLILEDLEHVFHNTAILGLLRSALWGPVDEHGRMTRTVTWTSSTTKLEEVPATFNVTTGFVLMANSLPTTSYFKALLTRTPTVDFNVAPEHVYEFMEKLVQGGQRVYDTRTKASVYLPREDCLGVIGFLKEKRVTDLRVLQLSLKLYTTFREGGLWRSILGDVILSDGQQSSARDQGPVNGAPPRRSHDLLDLVAKLGRRRDLSIKEQEAIFRERTGKSRATFFRFRARLPAEDLAGPCAS